MPTKGKNAARECTQCKTKKPKSQFSPYQLDKSPRSAGGVFNECLCNACVGEIDQAFFSKINDAPTHTEDEDKLLHCEHGLERCDICMVDMTLMNRLQRKRNELKREDLTADESRAICMEYTSENTKIKNYSGFDSDDAVKTRKTYCIMSSLAVCPRSEEKFKCGCSEGVCYCSKQCQKAHWKIHKMTCELNPKFKGTAAGLVEREKDFVRRTAFMHGDPGTKLNFAAIDEAAHFLGEHPLCIGGGGILLSGSGDGMDKFQKCDPQSKFAESGIKFDGKPRFGLGPYVPNGPLLDWYAIGKSVNEEAAKFARLKAELGF
jgi:hypothetical protein